MRKSKSRAGGMVFTARKMYPLGSQGNFLLLFDNFKRDIAADRATIIVKIEDVREAPWNWRPSFLLYI